ncbi:MAG TPA: neprosin family prolyl endopeptidase, partial [Gemmataceae bacterium]|nr:neprosin family prolyl endopeptidase [Gemmataceae bacterium]
MRRITISQMAQRGKFEDFFCKYPTQTAAQPVRKGKKPATAKAAKSSSKTAKPRKSKSTKGVATPFPFAGSFGNDGSRPTEIHRHAICQDASGGNYFGCSTWLNVWQTDPMPGQFNLSQTWIIGSCPSGMQTIESGWQMLTDAPVLFVFYNPDNYNPATSGYVSASNHHGFQQTTSDWIVGGAMPAPYSQMGDDQRGYQMQWEFVNDNTGGKWWLYMGTGDQPPEAIGCFPAQLYRNGTLARSAQVIQFGGEVASQFPGVASWPNTGRMGSGQAPHGTDADSFG